MPSAQRQMVLPPAVTGSPTSSPLAMTSLPAGTLMGVVHREPAGGALRLVDDEGAVIGGDPALDRLVRIRDRLRLAGVDNRHAELLAVLELRPRVDRQLLLVVLSEGRGPVVDRDSRHRVEVSQIQVEAAEILGRGRADHDAAAEEVRRLVVVDRERVMARVVAPVPGLREERIARAG